MVSRTRDRNSVLCLSDGIQPIDFKEFTYKICRFRILANYGEIYSD